MRRLRKAASSANPYFIRRVEDHEGHTLFQSDAKPRRAMSEETAFMMATMLADVIDAWNGQWRA
jgi:membrane peptidoglycan carboxypeptidase